MISHAYNIKKAFSNRKFCMTAVKNMAPVKNHESCKISICHNSKIPG